MLPMRHTWRHDQGTKYLYEPYSIKLARRVKLYGPELYDFWAEFEFDPQLRGFNELPDRLTYKEGRREVALRLSAMIETRLGRHVGIVLTADIGETTELLREFEPVARSEAIELEAVLWPRLRTSRLLRENRHRMLRFLTLYSIGITPDLRARLTNIIGSVQGGLSIRRVQKSIGDLAPSLCVAGIAQLLLDGAIFAAIDTQPFDLALVVHTASS
jgi:hypothetical protein